MSTDGQRTARAPARRRARPLLLGPGHVMPPADLGPEGLALWHRLAPQIARFGLLHGEGAGLLAEYCRLSVTWRGVHEAALREGEALQSPRARGGNAKLKELLRLNRRLLALGDRLGMSPLARARLGVR